MKLIKLLLPLLPLMLLSGCVAMPTGPMVTTAPAPGKPFNVFRSEFEECKKLAGQHMGNYYDYETSAEAQFYYDNAFVKCMTSHGNRILPARMIMIEDPEHPEYLNEDEGD